MNSSFVQWVKKRFLNRAERNAALLNFMYWLLALIYLEVLLHATAYGSFDGKFTYTLGFSVLHAGVLTLLTSFVPKKAHFPVTAVLTVVLIILYGSQMVYDFIFGTLYSVALMQQGGAAVTSFWRELFATMWEKLPFILLLLLPAIALTALRLVEKHVFSPSNAVWRIILACGSVIAYAVTLLCLQIGGTGYFSNYYYYHDNSAATNQTAERFGLLTAFRLELTATDDSSQGDDYYIDVPNIPVITEPVASSPTAPSGGSAPDQTVPEQTEPVVEYNVLDIDFNALNGLTENEKIIALNNYCAQLTGTKKNEYTGMLHDYNLIVLCAESFATGAIHPELTPTLYRLANEGIIFNNYYNTFPNTTTDGEYALCMGLFPDSSRNKSESSMFASRKSYLPYTLGNVFSEQAGLPAYGYHNYVGDYYGRDETHPNMGYTMKFAGQGMSFTYAWPASDLEMMQQSIDDYIGQDQFHAYYMTFSGHMLYDTSTNLIANKNWNAVKNLDMSRKARAYLSCNIELDKALEYLMQRLEEEGIADKTAIVLAGDHFPYGLTDSEYAELVGHKLDSFSKYKSTLIFWVGGLEENIVVDEYCCNVDILPTILNLWGFQYDSRMLAGTDVFSDGNHMAVLVDKSFLTDKIWFNANTGEVRYLVDESLIPEGYVDSLIRLVSTKFSVSANILNTAYYNFVFEKGNVRIDYSSWWTDYNNNFGVDPEPEETEPGDIPSTEPSIPGTEPSVPDDDPGTEPTVPDDGPGTKPTVPSGDPDPDPTVPSGDPDPDPTVPSGDPDPDPTVPSGDPDPDPTAPSGDPDPDPTVPSADPDPDPTVPSGDPDPDPTVPGADPGTDDPAPTTEG